MYFVHRLLELVHDDVQKEDQTGGMLYQFPFLNNAW